MYNDIVPLGQEGSGEGSLNVVSTGRGLIFFLKGLEMGKEETVIWFPIVEPFKQQYILSNNLVRNMYRKRNETKNQSVKQQTFEHFVQGIKPFYNWLFYSLRNSLPVLRICSEHIFYTKTFICVNITLIPSQASHTGRQINFV